MKFLTLDITNFMSIGHAKLDLAASGLHLIQGVNLDDSSASSNGSGKSSIPDALMWCLFGTTARGESGDSIVNKTAKKNCGVIVTVESEGRYYIIARHRKADLGKNRLTVDAFDPDSGKIDKLTAASDEATAALVAKIIGCNQSVFQAAVYAAQENMPNLPDMSDKFLKQIVEEAAGIDILTQCLAKARENGLAIAGKIKEKQSQLKFTIKAIENNEDLQRKAKEKAESWGIDTKNAIDKVEETIRLSEEDWRVKKAEEEKNKAQLAEIQSEIDQVTSDLRMAKELNEEVKVLQKALSAAETRVAVAKTELGSIAKNIRAKSEEHSSASVKIGKPCGECGKEVCEEDLEAVLKAIRADLDDLAVRFKIAKEAVSKAELERTEASSKFEAMSVRIKDVPKMIARAEFLVAQKKGLSLAPDNLRVIEARIEGHKTTLENLRKSQNPYHEAFRELMDLIAAGEKEKKGLEKEIDDLNIEAAINAEVVKVYGPAGVRAHMLDHVTPFLNGRTAHYLDALTDGNITAVWSTIKLDSKGEYKEKFNIQVKSNTGGHVYGLLSGGEKRKVRIATSLALQDLIASRATKPFNLFMADEIDDALDESGMERLMSLLESLSSVRGTVIVISHNELSKWIPQQTIVTKSGGKAEVKGSLVKC